LLFPLLLPFHAPFPSHPSSPLPSRRTKKGKIKTAVIINPLLFLSSCSSPRPPLAHYTNNCEEKEEGQATDESQWAFQIDQAKWLFL
jgi:hypothetical protein